MTHEIKLIISAATGLGNPGYSHLVAKGVNILYECVSEQALKIPFDTEGPKLQLKVPN
jgi:hypothetical protein